MATMLMRWLVAWTIYLCVVTKVGGEKSDKNKSHFHTEADEFLKKRIMEEETLIKFINQLSKISQRLQLRTLANVPQGAAKRIGSEFLGKRGSSSASEQQQPQPQVVVAAAGDAETMPLSNDIATAAILANQLLNFVDTSTSRKRLGSEFLGKRNLIGSEFLGKKSSYNDRLVTKDDDQSVDRVTTEESAESSNFISNK